QGPRGASPRGGPHGERRDPAGAEHPARPCLGVRREGDPRARDRARHPRHHHGGGRARRRLRDGSAEAWAARRRRTPGERLTVRFLQRAALGAAAAAMLAGSASCAFYNTYYLARKYYDRGTGGAPYVVERKTEGVGGDVGNFNKAIDYSKKLIAQYPKSKWV